MSEEKKTHSEHKYSVTFVSKVGTTVCGGNQQLHVKKVKNQFIGIIDKILQALKTKSNAQNPFLLSGKTLQSIQKFLLKRMRTNKIVLVLWTNKKLYLLMECNRKFDYPHLTSLPRGRPKITPASAQLQEGTAHP